VIIDSQVHIWAAETPERPWAPGEAGLAHLPVPFGYEDLLREMVAVGVDRAILVPPGWEGGRIDYATEAVTKYPDRFAIMGKIALDRPESRALVPTWMQQKGMLGVRLSFQHEHTRAAMGDGTADWFWPAAEAAGIPIMIFAPHWLAEIRAIAHRHPHLKLIVDHLGLYRQKGAAAAAAIEQTIALAECPNIFVKVSCVPAYSSEPYPFRDLHAPLRRLIGAFGAERAFWGSDLTKLRGSVSYRQCVSLFTDELDFLSEHDRALVMGRGIADVLGWP
jgi:predicted TIM-barrel fold metal-dependent hydrolase